MTFIEHLEELRSRLLKSVVAIFAGMIVCWVFREDIRLFLEAPLYEAWRAVPGLPPPSPLSFTSLIEPFMAYLKIAGIGGLFLAAPVVFYHLWRFIAPGLYRSEQRIALPFVVVSSLLFVVGSIGAYRYVFPVGFTYFLEFAAGGSVENHEADVRAFVPPKKPAPAKKAGATAAEKKTAAKRAAQGMNRARWKAKIAQQQAQRAAAESRDASAGKLIRWLADRMGSGPCGEFSAKRQKSDVYLRYLFFADRCGEPPAEMIVSRNGRPLDISFTWGLPSGGRQVFAAVDANAPRAGQYSLRVVRPAVNKLAPMLMVKDYLDFALKLLLAFGVVFELPILILFLAWAGIVDHRQLFSFGRWFIVLSLVIGAILTPPDVFTQVMLAVPLILLYYVSALLAYLFFGRKKKA